MRRASARSRSAQPVPDTLIMFSASGSRSRWIAGALLTAPRYGSGARIPRTVRARRRSLRRHCPGDAGRGRLGDAAAQRIKYLEKPPLQYWATAGAFSVLGVDEWTARLCRLTTGFLGIALTAFAGFRLAPRSCASRPR